MIHQDVTNKQRGRNTVSSESSGILTHSAGSALFFWVVFVVSLQLIIAPTIYEQLHRLTV